MMTRVLLTVLSLSLSATTFAAQCTTGALSADYTDAPGARLVVVGEQSMALEFEIIDGRSGEALDAASGDLRDGMRVSQAPVADGEMIRWPLIFTNAGDTQRWLEVRAVTVPGGGGPFGFWNGHDDYSPAPAEVPPMPADMSTPLVSLSGENAGVAWGLEADALMSWYQGAATDGRFWFACRIVIDPGETYTLPLVIFSHPTTFGYLDAFERYHDLFPQSFAIGANPVDPRATGAGCDYVGWHEGSPELVRRVGGTWDWCMKSWRLPGNWANRPELWRDSFGNLERWNANWAAKAEHMELCDFAGMYYIWPAWTDEDLAAERWPDALVHDPLAPRLQWENVTMAHLTFPADPDYLTWTQEHLREVLAGGKYHGFGLDSAGSDGRARGAAAQASPGRAWDEDGVYCRVNVGMAQLMDAIHEMEAPDGYRAAAVPNGGDWMILSRADSILIEHSPLRRELDWIDRLNAGEKVLNWWDQFDVWQLTDWQDASPEQLRHDVAAMSRFMRLRSLQLGGVPMYRQASGVMSTMEDLPEIAEIVGAGWQPVPAMKGDDRLWLSRYGDGNAGEVRLVACNPKDEPISGEIEVFGEYIGNGGWLMMDETGVALAQRVSGSRTVLDATVPPAWQKVFQPVAMVSADAEFTATVSLLGDIHQRVLRIEVTDSARPFEIAPLAWSGWEPVGPAAPIAVPGTGIVDIAFASTSFASPAEEILSFPFIGEDGQPACTIVLPEGATGDEQYAAFRVQEYFRFIGSQPDRDGKPTIEGPMIPIVRGEAEGPRVVLRMAGRDGFSVGSDGGDLIVEYARPELASEAVYRLLALLDREHPFYGATPEKFEDEREQSVYERGGLIDAVLDDRAELGM
ncbi:MAG: hypothetical protein GX131_07755 [candidate division WS1 bacterium]|nr:hypothetical protein [candidate division WS1 bacterium]